MLGLQYSLTGNRVGHDRSVECDGQYRMNIGPAFLACSVSLAGKGGAEKGLVSVWNKQSNVYKFR